MASNHDEEVRCEESEGDDRESFSRLKRVVTLIDVAEEYEVRKGDFEATMSSLIHEYLVVLLLDTAAVDERLRASSLDRDQLSRLVLQQLQAAAKVREIDNLLSTLLYNNDNRSTTVTLLEGRIATAKRVVEAVDKRIDDAVEATDPPLTSQAASLWKEIRAVRKNNNGSANGNR